MIKFEHTVSGENGIHARPAGALVKCAQQFSSQVQISKGDSSIDGKRLISLMSLGARRGELLSFAVDGKDEKEAASALQSLCRELPV